MKDIEIAPTVVPTIWKDVDHAQSRYGDFAHILHVDAADGMFAANLTWMPIKGDQLPTSKLAYEVHLMVDDPEPVGITFAQAGASRIIGHVETFSTAEAVETAFTSWKASGAKEVGLGLRIETPLHVLDSLIGFCDFVLLMTIAEIGKQGTPFDERSIGRVAELRARYHDLVIAVDGGITELNAKQLTHAGASRLCVGSALASAPHPAEAYLRMSALAQLGVN